MARLLLQVASPAHRRLEKATSAPRPLETSAASSAIPDAEATSAAPVGWVRGGGNGQLNQALLDVQAKLRAEGDAIQSFFVGSGRIFPATFFVDDLTSFPFYSLEANATLQQQLGEANTALRAKGEECSKLVTERDLLVA